MRFGAVLISIVWLSIYCLACIAQPPSGAHRVTTVPLTHGWMVFRPGQGAAPAQTADNAGTKVLDWQLEQANAGVLAAPDVPIRGFSRLSLRLWSQQKAIVAVVLEDRDKAKFHAGAILEPNAWTNIAVAPADFEINDDSPVRKSALDPQLVTSTLMIVEPKVLGATPSNKLMVTGVQIEHGSAPTASLDVPAVIDGKTVSITAGGTISHPVNVRNGGKLILKAPSIHLGAKIMLDHATLEVDGGEFVIDNKFSHQLGLFAVNNSAIALNECTVSSRFISDLKVKNSRLEIKNCQSRGEGCFTCEPENSTIALENDATPGEFIVEPGSHYRLSHCRGALLWLKLGDQQKADLVLPPTSALHHYTAPPSTKLDLLIDDSIGINWALITLPGADVTVRNSSLRATGLVFPLSAPVKIANIEDHATLNKRLNLSDRNVSFANTKVEAFTFYPIFDAHLEITDCIFGELNAFKSCEISVRNSTCDGSGGYVLAAENARVRFTNCKLTCLVVTSGRGQLTLDRCQISGDVTAADDSSIDLIGCTLNGKTQEVGNGRIKKLAQ